MFTVREKSSPAHFGPFLVQICPFLAQNQDFGLYLPNGSSNLADFWSLGISGRTYGFALVRPCVRAWRDIWRSAHQIFLKLCTKLHLGETKKVPSKFYKKILVCPPRGFLNPKPPFWLKNGLLSLYLRNRASDFDDFFTEVRDSCTE